MKLDRESIGLVTIVGVGMGIVTFLLILATFFWH